MKSDNLLQNKTIKYHGIPITRVINADYLDSLRDIYKCNICFKIMINPSDCEKCGHSYCYDCISDSHCPFNCENSSIRPSSMGIKLILNNLLFRCENEGCQEKINYNSITNHDLQCDWKIIKCPNINCGLNLAKKNLQVHIEKDCKFTNEKCKFCGYEFPRMEITNHLDSCEHIFHSLNLSNNDEINININNSSDSLNNSTNRNSLSIIAKKDLSRLKAKSYLEALSLNLSKFVKENDQKYKSLQEENLKTKQEYNSEVKDLLVKMSEKLNDLNGKDNQIKSVNNDPMKDELEKNNGYFLIDNIFSGEENNKNNEIQLSNGLTPEYGSLSNLTEKKESKLGNIRVNLKDILQYKLKENLLNEVNQNLDARLDEHENRLKEAFISETMKENVKFNEEIVKIIKQIVKISEDNIKSFLKDIKSYIIEEFKDQLKITYNEEIFKKIEKQSEEFAVNFTNFNLDFTDIKNKIGHIFKENYINFKGENTVKNKGNHLENREIFKENEEEYEKLWKNDYNIIENLNILKIKSEEIEKFIKKLFEVTEKNSHFKRSNEIEEDNLMEYNSKSKEFEEFKTNLLDKIKEKLDEKNTFLSKNMEDSLFDLKSNIQSNFEKCFEEIEFLKSLKDKEQNKSFHSGDEKEDKSSLNIEKLISNFMKNVIEIFDDKIQEVKLFIDEKTQIDNSKEKIINEIQNFKRIDKNQISDYEFKVEEIIQKFQNNISEEFENIKTDIKSFTKNNKEIKSIITEEFGELSEALKNLSKQEKNFDNKNEDNLINLINQNFIEEHLEKKIDLLYNKLNGIYKINFNEEMEILKKDLISNIYSSFVPLSQNYQKIENEMKNVQENLENLSTKFEKFETINDKIDYLQEGFSDEINNFSQNTQKTINFNHMDLLIKIKENIEEIKQDQPSFNQERKYTTDNKIPFPLISTEESQRLKIEITSSLEEKISEKLIKMEDKIEEKIGKKLQEFYELKWCVNCEKVDYNFSFTKCKICIRENCKDCIKLCKICKTLNCKKCSNCPKCREYCCINCRSNCHYCSVEKNEKFCTECLKNCYYCKKTTCTECTRQCLNCSCLTCRECARLCRICLKCSCRRCETIKNFKSCFHCKQTACNECIVECTNCNLEVCNNCFNSCKNCNKLLCKKCGVDCENCADIFCDKCAKELNQNNCYLCKKLFCVSCTKYLRKCKKCSGNACKNCCANCLKCKNVFCKNCNVNCDSCEDYACVLCVYKCSCEKLIFCEKCLFGINPISPDLHNCVLWLNESPVFTGMKSRSKLGLPKNFEAKFYLEKFDSLNFLIGITDNSTFNEDTLAFIDNIWAFKPRTGQKYSSKKSLELYYNREAREKDFVIIAVKNDSLYFRVNFDDNPPAYQLPPNKDYFIYIENDSMLSNLRVKFVYLRKI